VFFALELILRNFEAESFGYVVISSVTADAIGRAAFGSHRFLTLPGFNFTSPLELLLYAGLGVLAVGVGLAFVRVLYVGEDFADRLWRGPAWLRPGSRWGPARPAAARGPADVRRRLSGAAASRRRPLRRPRPARTTGREDPGDQPDDVDWCAIVVATALSNKLTKDTIYTLKLRRRGIDIDTPKTPSRMAQITVAKAMGIIAAVDVERAIDHGPDDTANGAGLAREVPRLLASDSLEDAVRALGGTDDEGLPVIDDNNQVLGWITHRRVLRAYLARCGSADPPETESPDSLA